MACACAGPAAHSHSWAAQEEWPAGGSTESLAVECTAGRSRSRKSAGFAPWLTAVSETQRWLGHCALYSAPSFVTQLV
eukprot:6193275-Pleurochrysis_carterae.AAC.6